MALQAYGREVAGDCLLSSWAATSGLLGCKFWDCCCAMMVMSHCLIVFDKCDLNVCVVLG